MPNRLTEYLTELDASTVDAKQKHGIEQKLGEIAHEFEVAQEIEPARFARIEQETIAASKSLENRVGYQMSGTGKDADGNEQAFGWPDTSRYGADEYAYLKERLQTTNNLYLKSEYGFFLYLKKQATRPEEVAALITVFYQLAQHYFDLDTAANEKSHYVLYGVQSLELAFRIAVSRQQDKPVAPLLPPLVDYLFTTQQQWDATRTGTPMLAGTFTSLVTEQPALFQGAGYLTDFLAKNRQMIEVLGHTYRYGAMELAQATAQLAKKVNLDAQPWLLLVATQYELLTQEAIEQHNSAAATFAQQALRLYQGLYDADGIARMEQQYQVLRSQSALNTVKTTMPDEENQARLDAIMQQVAQSDEQQLIDIISLTPMFISVAEVRAHEQSAEKLFTDYFSTVVEDKYGNPVQIFSSEDEKKEFRVLSAYGLLGQLATQTLVKLMLESYKADKLTAAGIVQRLAESWLGEPREQEENGRIFRVYPLRLCASGIQVMFGELDRWRSGETDEPDFIAATDSLVLKVEYILRYICARLGIATFRPKNNGVVHEKLLADLLTDLEGRLEPDDLFFIRFYLQEKVGQNLRNRVAHGLMDDNEYGVEKAFLVLTMILKLAAYEFRPQPNA